MQTCFTFSIHQMLHEFWLKKDTAENASSNIWETLTKLAKLLAVEYKKTCGSVCGGTTSPAYGLLAGPALSTFFFICRIFDFRLLVCEKLVSHRICTCASHFADGSVGPSGENS